MMAKLLPILYMMIIQSEPARILGIFPSATVSHQSAFRPITQTLAKRGHEVVVITPSPAFPDNETPANLKEINVNDIGYKAWSKRLTPKTVGGDNFIHTGLRLTLEVAAEAVDKFFEAPQVRELLEERFDLLLVEAWVRPAMLWAHVFKVPVIKISSLGPTLDNYDIVGGPTHPVFFSGSIQKKNYNHTFWEKIYAVYQLLTMNYLYKSLESGENDMARRHFPDAPSMSDLSGKVRMVFINLHPMWEGNRPVPPSVVHTGGLHQPDKNEISEELNQFLDKSNNGLIFISFGTSVVSSQIPENVVEVFKATFSQLPYNVLWRWNQDLSSLPQNVRVEEWFPQSEILKHPNVKLFITQGGIQSTDEAIAAGVPLIGMPLMADQFKNVDNYVLYQIGVSLDMAGVNVDDLKRAIYAVIGDSRYKDNIVKLRRLLLDQPMTALERAVWWTEYVVRHDAVHVRSPAAGMSVSDYYEIPLLLIVLAWCTITCFAFYFILRYLIIISVICLKNNY